MVWEPNWTNDVDGSDRTSCPSGASKDLQSHCAASYVYRRISRLIITNILNLGDKLMPYNDNAVLGKIMFTFFN